MGRWWSWDTVFSTTGGTEPDDYMDCKIGDKNISCLKCANQIHWIEITTDTDLNKWIRYQSDIQFLVNVVIKSTVSATSYKLSHSMLQTQSFTQCVLQVLNTGQKSTSIRSGNGNSIRKEKVGSVQCFLAPQKDSVVCHSVILLDFHRNEDFTYTSPHSLIYLEQIHLSHCLAFT